MYEKVGCLEVHILDRTQISQVLQHLQVATPNRDVCLGEEAHRTRAELLRPTVEAKPLHHPDCSYACVRVCVRVSVRASAGVSEHASVWQ